MNFIGKENLCLITKIENIKNNIYSCYSNFTFRIQNQLSKENTLYGLIFGLLLNDNNFDANFMNQIKNKNIISSKLISINYNNEKEGIILIGKYPHDIYPTKYKNKRLKTFYPNKANIASLSINFYEIYTINNNEKIIIEKNINSHLLLNSDLIVGTNEYMKFIENTFFNQFIFKNICRKNYGSTGWEDFTIFS